MVWSGTHWKPITFEERSLVASGTGGLLLAVFPYTIRICTILVSTYDQSNYECLTYPHESLAPQYTLSCPSFAYLRP